MSDLSDLAFKWKSLAEKLGDDLNRGLSIESLHRAVDIFRHYERLLRPVGFSGNCADCLKRQDWARTSDWVAGRKAMQMLSEFDVQYPRGEGSVWVLEADKQIYASKMVELGTGYMVIASVWVLGWSMTSNSHLLTIIETLPTFGTIEGRPRIWPIWERVLATGLDTLFRHVHSNLDAAEEHTSPRLLSRARNHLEGVFVCTLYRNIANGVVVYKEADVTKLEAQVELAFYEYPFVQCPVESWRAQAIMKASIVSLGK